MAYQQIREFRLADENALNPDGSPTSPVSGTAGRDVVREIAIAFSAVTVTDATPDSTPGTQFSALGYGVVISPTSDATTLMSISIDGGANYVRMTPGMRLDGPGRFDRIFIKRSSTLPSDSTMFYLSVLLTKAASIVLGTPGTVTLSSASTPNVGAGSGSVTVTTSVALGPPSSTILAARAARRSLTVFNQGPGDMYVGFANTVDNSNGVTLAAGGSLSLNYAGAVFASASAASTRAEVVEVYS